MTVLVPLPKCLVNSMAIPTSVLGTVLRPSAEWEFAARSGSSSDIWTENGGGVIVESDELSLFCYRGHHSRWF